MLQAERCSGQTRHWRTGTIIQGWPSCWLFPVTQLSLDLQIDTDVLQSCRKLPLWIRAFSQRHHIHAHRKTKFRTGSFGHILCTLLHCTTVTYVDWWETASLWAPTKTILFWPNVAGMYVDLFRTNRKGCWRYSSLQIVYILDQVSIIIGSNPHSVLCIVALLPLLSPTRFCTTRKLFWNARFSKTTILYHRNCGS